MMQHLFKPLSILIISGLIAFFLSDSALESTHRNVGFMLFDSLFLYWSMALIFNLRVFMKARLPTHEKRARIKTDA